MSSKEESDGEDYEELDRLYKPEKPKRLWSYRLAGTEDHEWRHCLACDSRPCRWSRYADDEFATAMEKALGQYDILFGPPYKTPQAEHHAKLLADETPKGRQLLAQWQRATAIKVWKRIAYGPGFYNQSKNIPPCVVTAMDTYYPVPSDEEICSQSDSKKSHPPKETS